MLSIQNQEELRRAYSFLRMCQEPPETPRRAALVPELKKDIREYQRKHFMNKKRESRVVKGDWDWAIVLEELGQFDSKQEADDYFKREEFLECPNSQYDCTGKLFTAWYKIFQRRGLYYAYHMVRMDV